MRRWTIYNSVRGKNSSYNVQKIKDTIIEQYIMIIERNVIKQLIKKIINTATTCIILYSLKGMKMFVGHKNIIILNYFLGDKRHKNVKNKVE